MHLTNWAQNCLQEGSSCVVIELVEFVMRDECYDRDNNNTIADPGCYNVHVSLARVSKYWQLMRDGDEESLRSRELWKQSSWKLAPKSHLQILRRSWIKPLPELHGRFL